MKDIRILLCDDHSLLRKGIKSLFDESVGYFVVGEASNGKEMILKYNELLPDMIIADISMPELTGPDALKQLRIRYPEIKVLFISMYLGEQYIYLVLQAGGKGLIGKNLEKGELLFAVNQILLRFKVEFADYITSIGVYCPFGMPHFLSYLFTG
jgi:DNA-binding NarL/FixJ family response regulator